jgi:exosortase
MSGPVAFRRLLFPALFLIFTIPLPGALLDGVLLPLKEQVSNVVVTVLFSLGVPVARAGVVIFVGPYQLLIANACSGLNSMIALMAVSLVYVHMTNDRNPLRNLLLLLTALPIAFLANVLRVAALVLVTFFYGDRSSRYVHSFAAYAEIAFAFAAFFMLDTLINVSMTRFHTKRGAPNK